MYIFEFCVLPVLQEVVPFAVVTARYTYNQGARFHFHLSTLNSQHQILANKEPRHGHFRLASLPTQPIQSVA